MSCKTDLSCLSVRSANLGNDHEFISNEYISTGMRPLEEIKSKVMRAYTQSGQYRTIVEIRDS